MNANATFIIVSIILLTLAYTMITARCVSNIEYKLEDIKFEICKRLRTIESKIEELNHDSEQ